MSYDPPSDIGGVLKSFLVPTSAVKKVTWESEVFDYLHSPRNLNLSRSQNSLKVNWNKQPLSDRVNILFIKITLSHSVRNIPDNGEYTWPSAGAGSYTVKVEAVASQWDDENLMLQAIRQACLNRLQWRCSA